jgi:hypothetical protein
MKNISGGKNKVRYQNTATMILPFDPNKLAIPNTENKVAAGTILLLDNEPAIVVNRVDMPFIGPQDGAVAVYGESMAPTFPHGCIFGIRRMADPQKLIFGACYFIIDINFQIFVRRVYRYEVRWLRLVCDNTNFPPANLDWDQIAVIFSITSTTIKQ